MINNRMVPADTAFTRTGEPKSLALAVQFLFSCVVFQHPKEFPEVRPPMDTQTQESIKTHLCVSTSPLKKLLGTHRDGDTQRQGHYTEMGTQRQGYYTEIVTQKQGCIKTGTLYRDGDT